MAESIKVITRFRPQNSREKAANAFIVVKVSDCHTMCQVTHPDKSKQPKPLTFNFDCVFDWTSTQSETYEHAASHLVEQIFDGFNATIFAYGQTGAGKTYSMEGKLGSPHRGIVPRTVENIFETIADAEESMEYLLQVSYVEIYLEALRDLFKPQNAGLKIRDSKTGVYIENVTEMYVRDAQEVMDLMTQGSRARTVGATNMNATSSRSHGVFMLKLTQTNTVSGTKKVSKLMMIDLAGSEKVGKTGAKGQLLKEAQKINQSLSALGNVMSQLSSGGSHISYRDSVLTRLLSDSLGGNCKTTLLIAASPSSFNVDETITTLRFGARAKKIKNKAKINAEKTVAEYKVEVAELQQRIKYLQMLVKAFQIDLAKARVGDLKEGQRGKSDAVLSAIDIKYLMDDGTKKKKKKDKKKGFIREGVDPASFASFGLDDDKKKKKKKKKKDKKSADPFGGADDASSNNNNNKADEEVEEEEEDDDDENKYEEKSDEHSDHDHSDADKKRLADAEKRAETAEQHIQYLEAELIKAQAAAATNSGLADVEPAPSPRRRGSILPAPHRPRASLNQMPSPSEIFAQKSGTNTLSIPLGSTGSNTNDQSINTVPSKVASSSTSPMEQTDFGFQSVLGTAMSEEDIQRTVIEQKLIMPSHLSDLDPALLEQARRGLQQENYDLRKQMEQLVVELDQMRERMQKKQEAVNRQKHKTEDAEMECDRMLLQQQVLMERIEAFEQDRTRERKQIESFKNENTLFKKETELLKSKLAQKDKLMNDQIAKITKREAKRADDFMQQAIKQFKRLQSQQKEQNAAKQREIKRMQLQMMKNSPGGQSAYAQMQQQQLEQDQQKAMMDEQMQRLKQATFEQLERIQLEQMKVKSALQSKIEETVSLNMALEDREDEIKILLQKIQQKDATLHRQGLELKQFGDLKLMSDQIHQKEFKKAQDTIYSLKKQLAEIQRMNVDDEQQRFHGGSAMKNHQRMVIPTPIRGGGRKSVHKKENNEEQKEEIKKNNGLPQPMRGGNGQRKMQRSGPSQTSLFFNQKMRSPQPSNSPLPGYNMHMQRGGGGGRGHRSINSTHSSVGMRFAQNMNGSSSVASPNKKPLMNRMNSGSYW